MGRKREGEDGGRRVSCVVPLHLPQLRQLKAELEVRVLYSHCSVGHRNRSLKILACRSAKLAQAATRPVSRSTVFYPPGSLLHCSRTQPILYDMPEQVEELAQFTDLPVELLPIVVQHIVRPSHLAAVCLVNQSFYTFASPLLYERIFIYAWHKEGKAKVCA